jgi:hypothetical protein
MKNRQDLGYDNMGKERAFIRTASWMAVPFRETENQERVAGVGENMTLG